MVVKLGPNALFDVDTGTEYPMSSIADGALTLVVTPSGASEGGQLTKCDAGTGPDLVLAASRYRNALAEAYAQQEVQELSRRRPSRMLLDGRDSKADSDA